MYRHAFQLRGTHKVTPVLGKASINGEGFMYVDDFVAVGGRALHNLPVGHSKDNGSWQQDRGRVIRLMVGLLGDNAEAEFKREDSDHSPGGDQGEYWGSLGPSQPRHISVLGWEINLSTWTLGVAEKKRIRAIHAFGSFDPKRHHPRKTYEKAATSASQGRALDSFRPRTNRVIIEFDGSLKGVGARVILPGVDSLDTVISACTATFPTFDLGNDSSYQMKLSSAMMFVVAIAEHWEPPGR